MLQRLSKDLYFWVIALNVLLAAYLVWPKVPLEVAVFEHPATVAAERPVAQAPAMIAESGEDFALIDPTVTEGLTPKVFKRFRTAHHASHPTKAAFKGVLNINTAGLGELQKLPGIGPAMAKRIVAYRNAHGPFASLSDLGGVSGIGPKKLAKLAPFCKF